MMIPSTVDKEDASVIAVAAPGVPDEPLAAAANDDDDKAEEPPAQQQQSSSSTVEEQQQHGEPGTGQGKEKEEEDRIVDEEGLLKDGYDVILCGTSLVQSILASALARAGKKVLHCDAADYYGELDAVWTLPYLQEQQPQQWQKLPEQQSDIVPNDDDDSTSRTSILSLSSSGGWQGFQIHSMARFQNDDFGLVAKHGGNVVMTPYGQGRVVVLGKTGTSHGNASVSMSLTDWKLANGQHPTLFVGIPPDLMLVKESSDTRKENADTAAASALNRYLINTAQIIPHRAILAREILDGRSRSFALDITPGLLYAHGPAVQGLLTSRVADYLEFKSLQGLWWYHSDDNNDSSSKKRTTNTANANNARLEMVPCSKNDVFTSTLLNPMEKRRLMKFLQLALDYATAQEAAADAAAAAQEEAEQGHDAGAADDDGNTNLAIVQSLNERHLNQGRSLARPQNKAVNTSDMATLQQCIANENIDFDRYLQEKHALSFKLRSLVRYALALEVMGSSSTCSNSSSDGNIDKSNNNSNKPLLVEEGMKRLCRHMQALGRFGSTAFLIPLYGSGELSQAFCRSAAVYGATYILRRCMRGIVIAGGGAGVDSSSSMAANNSGDDGNDDVTLQQQQRHTVGVLISQPTGTESSPSSPSPVPVNSLSLRDLKQIPCQHVVIPESALLRQELQHGQHRHHHAKVARRRVLRRISILQGKPKILLQSKQSKEDTNSSSRQCRHAIILPPGSLDGSGHSSTLGPQKYTIQGLVLDESINVAPHMAPDGCCIVHLSTIVDVADDNDPADVTETQTLLLKRALDTSILANDATVQEIFHVSFSFPLYDDDDVSSLQSQHEEHIKGLHVVRRPPPSLTVDPDVEQAREIFNRICPGVEFLTLSKEIETAVKERFGDACNPNDADDDEKLVLESAMGMIGGNDTASNSAADANAGPLFIWLGRFQHEEETDTGPARTPAHKLLLPVPRPSTPNVTVVGSQEQATDAPATTSEQVMKLIRKHYSTPGPSSDPRIYFASPSERDDIMEYSVLIKESIAAVKKAGFSQLSFHVFTSGLVAPLAQIRLADLGIDCFHVSLFAGSKAEYAESTGRAVKIDAIEEEDEDGFTKVCGFISNAVQHDLAVEASVLKRYEENGRVLARSLGAREVHDFDLYQP